jgi:DNA mismatch endonuclease (patch repair protein)
MMPAHGVETIFEGQQEQFKTRAMCHEVSLLLSQKESLMSDIHTPAQRHRNMAAIHSNNTKPELILRKELWHLGFRYRINVKRLPGSPDIVLPKYRTVIFVHGCFWHGHKDCKNASTPKTNTDFWKAKITRNKERDQEVWRKLEAKGWSVIIVWECQLKKAALDETIGRVKAEIFRNGDFYSAAQKERRQSREAYRQMHLQQREKEAALLAELKER